MRRAACIDEASCPRVSRRSYQHARPGPWRDRLSWHARTFSHAEGVIRPTARLWCRRRARRLQPQPRFHLGPAARALFRAHQLASDGPA
jgi:hypothetical protein